MKLFAFNPNLPSKCNLCQELGSNLVLSKNDSQWNKSAATGSDATQLFFHHHK